MKKNELELQNKSNSETQAETQNNLDTKIASFLNSKPIQSSLKAIDDTGEAIEGFAKKITDSKPMQSTKQAVNDVGQAVSGSFKNVKNKLKNFFNKISKKETLENDDLTSNTENGENIKKK